MEQTKERRRLERAKGGVVLHLFFPTSLCGVLVFDSVSRSSRTRRLLPAPPPPLSHSTLSHTLTFTHNFVIHSLSHTALSHTLTFTHNLVTPSFTHNFVTHHLFHTELCHTPSFTHNFVIHSLSHTTLSRTIFHTQLCHTPSFTHNFVTHHLSHTTLSYFVTHSLSHTHLCHAPSFTHNFVTHHLSHTIFHTTLSHTILHTHTTLSQTLFPFAWQAWHLATSTCVWRGRRGACCTWLALVACLVAVSRLGRCATLRGRHGTCSHELSFCVAGVALGDIDFRFAW